MHALSDERLWSACQQQPKYSKENYRIRKINSGSSKEENVVDGESINHSVIHISYPADNDKKRGVGQRGIENAIFPRNMCQDDAENERDRQNNLEFEWNVEGNSRITMNSQHDPFSAVQGGVYREVLEGEGF